MWHKVVRPQEVRCYYAEQICGVIWEREEQNGPCTEERGRSEEVKAYLLPGTMFGSLTPMQPQSLLMFVASISTKGCTDIRES